MRSKRQISTSAIAITFVLVTGLVAQTAFADLIYLGDNGATRGVLHDATSGNTYVTTNEGLYTYTSGGSVVYSPITHPQWGNSTGVTAPRKAMSGQVGVAARFDEPGIGTSSALFDIANTSSPVVTWNDTKATSLDGSLNARGLFEGNGAGLFELNGNTSYLNYSSGYVGGFAMDVTASGVAGGRSLEISSGFSFSPTYWNGNNVFIINTSLDGDVVSIADGENGGLNFGLSLQNEAYAQLEGSTTPLQLMFAGSGIFSDDMFVYSDGEMLINANGGGILLYDGLANGETIDFNLLHASELSGITFDRTGKRDRTGGFDYHGLDNSNGNYLFITSSVPEPNAIVLLMLVLGIVSTRRNRQA